MHAIDTSGFNWSVPSATTPEYQKNEYEPLVSSGLTSIDLRTTIITDSETGSSATLASFFREIKDEVLRMSDQAEVSDGSNAARFDFVYDEETGRWGAGTAFLQDEE